MTAPQKLTIGRTVHFSLPPAYEGQEERLRPAVVVNVFDGTPPMANLTVTLDALNDLRDKEHFTALRARGVVIADAFLAVGSAVEGTAPGEWRWPARA